MQQVRDTPTLENTEQCTWLMGKQTSSSCVARDTTNDCRRDRSPRWPGGPPPPTCFGTTPYSGRGSPSRWRRSPEEVLGFPSAEAFQCLDSDGIKPRSVQPPSTTTHPWRSRPPRPGGAPAPRPQSRLTSRPSERIVSPSQLPVLDTCGPPAPAPRAFQPRRHKSPAGRRGGRKREWRPNHQTAVSTPRGRKKES